MRWRDKYEVNWHKKKNLTVLVCSKVVLPQMARVVGAKEIEVCVMNSLTVNLHLLMVGFYRPTPQRHKVIIEAGSFPSDLVRCEQSSRCQY